MALTDDQRAMLKLLAQREEGYEEMAALMGISVEELRGRVKEALAEVDEPAEEAAPEPPPAPRAAPDEPTPPVPPAPSAPTPQARPSASDQAPSNRGWRGRGLPESRGALIGIGLGLLALIGMAIALAVSGSSSTTGSAEDETAKLVGAIARNPNLTVAILKPTPDGEGEGLGVFGRVGKAVAMDVAAKGLEPSEPGHSYAVWFSHSGKAMVPMGTTDVSSSGELGARLEVTPAVLELIARGAFNQVDVTRVANARLKTAIATARKKNAEATYTGAPVLSGKIAGRLVRAAKRSGR